jgi:signal transduction histidine kinase
LRSHDGARLSAEGAAYLQKITSSVVRMKALIDDILAYSSLSGEEQKEQVSLYQVAQDVLLTLELPIKEKEARVTVSDLPSLFVYPIQIAQLFQNLLSNSLKFAKKEEPLQLTITHSLKKPSEVNGYAVQKAGEYLQIDVTDNGIGFDNKASEKIFGLFNRLHSKSTYEGTGLGLAICRKVAENHGGVIYARSSPGEGAVFSILLPVKNKS